MGVCKSRHIIAGASCQNKHSRRPATPGSCYIRVIALCAVFFVWVLVLLSGNILARDVLHGIGLLSLIALRDVVMVALCGIVRVVLINQRNDLLVWFSRSHSKRRQSVAFQGSDIHLRLRLRCHYRGGESPVIEVVMHLVGREHRAGVYFCMDC